MRCRICNHNTEYYFKYNENVEFLKCKNCGFIVRIPEENLVNYSDGYNISGLQKKVKKLSVGYYNYIGRYIENKTDVLEIGGSYGYFLKLLKDKKNCNVTNYELSKNSVEYCKQNGINATSDIKDLNYNKYDAIVSFHVLEHIENFKINEFLEYYFEKLKPGGVFISITPNGSAKLFSLLKKFYSWIAFPEHTVFFTGKSIDYISQNYDFQLLLNKSKIPNLHHYPSISIINLLRRRLAKIDDKILNSKGNLNNTKEKSSFIIKSIKKLYNLLIKTESLFHMIYLLPISYLSKEKEEIVFVLKKNK
jgi:SAM-dependent methyltransferase